MPIFEKLCLLTFILLLFSGLVLQVSAFEYSWEIDKTLEAAESATVGVWRNR